MVVAMEKTWGKIDELLEKVQHLEQQLGPGFARMSFMHSGTPSREAEAFIKSKGQSQFLDQVRGYLPKHTLAETFTLLAENMMDSLLREASSSFAACSGSLCLLEDWRAPSYSKSLADPEPFNQTPCKPHGTACRHPPTQAQRRPGFAPSYSRYRRRKRRGRRRQRQ